MSEELAGLEALHDTMATRRRRYCGHILRLYQPQHQYDHLWNGLDPEDRKKRRSRRKRYVKTTRIKLG